MISIREYLSNFIQRYGSPQLRMPGAWMPYQMDAAIHLFKAILLHSGGVLTWIWARQCGKTEAFAVAIAAAGNYIHDGQNSEVQLIEDTPYGAELRATFPEGLRVGIFTPKEESGTRDYNRIQPIIECIARENPDWNLRVNNTRKLLATSPVLDSGLRQVFLMELHSAAPGANVESGTFDVVAIEEAQDVEKHMIEAKLNPMRAATNGIRIEIGTVGDKVCQFDYDQDHNKAYDPASHFEVPYQVPLQANFQNGNYRAFIESELRRTGMSRDFRQKFCLERDYSTGMLVTEGQFLKLARPFELRWSDGQPEALPDQICIVAGLDVARSRDFTILKIGTSDWSRVDLADSFRHPWPDKCIRFTRTYAHEDYDAQWNKIQRDLDKFPELKSAGVLVIDTTGDRGTMAERAQAAGYYVISYVFKSGLKETEIDEKGQIVTGSKHHLCQQLEDAISTGHFGFAADEEYLGSLDWQRLNAGVPGFILHPSSFILDSDPEYREHKHQATHCFRVKRGNAVVFCADPNDDNAHDDHIDSDMLFVLGCNFHQPVNYQLAATCGQDRIMRAPALSDRPRPDSIRSSLNPHSS